MKLNFFLVFSLSLLFFPCFSQSKTHQTENVVLVTFDGYRWQELFKGAERKLITNPKQVSDTAALIRRFWAKTPEERRERLMPFFWSTIARQGQLYGNRNKGSRNDVSNPWSFSYPGYSEIFCGHAFRKVNSNNYPDNPHLNIFDFLNKEPGFQGRVAAFATWNAFPRIINTERTGVPVFTGATAKGTSATGNGTTFSEWSTYCPTATDSTAIPDRLTYHFAKEYMARNHPRFVFIGFDATDEAGHAGKYDDYLHAANDFDNWVKDLWIFIQNDSVYRDKTTLLITCDHGRGKIGKKLWHYHFTGIVSSHQTWLAAMGPDTKPLGEMRNGKQHYQNQIAQTIAHLFQLDYNLQPKAGKAIKKITGE